VYDEIYNSQNKWDKDYEYYRAFDMNESTLDDLFEPSRVSMEIRYACRKCTEQTAQLYELVFPMSTVMSTVLIIDSLLV
jgi:hypothetical protein